MPMSSPGEPNKTGDLLMRATAVYHYKVDYGTDQEPIACVSSYYDPSYKYSFDTNGNGTIEATENFDSTKNKVSIGTTAWNVAANGKSNNGIVYAFPGRSTFTANKTLLQRQAKLIFPNGRLVNEPLKNALTKIATGTTVPAPSTGFQLNDYSAIDTALCAISILSDETTFVATPANQPAHGAIKEASFLDAREAKQISKVTSAAGATPIVLSNTYNLDLEQRQPLEVRVTEINLGSLASTAIGTTEYLLPYSGIIYASRDDALRDASVPYVANDLASISNSELLSPTDFVLDPTRRPNGIRLINGETLARNGSTGGNAYNPKEKGLILVTNLPAYIKGQFNLHQATVGSGAEIEEFTEKEPATNFYARSTANTKFACRINRTGCSSTAGQGDFWRPATIIADSMTLLSGSSATVGFKDGVRSEGDYDLNNNTGVPFSTANTNLLKNGFAENNFVTSTDWWSSTNNNYPKTSLGSYTMNGVTPIQRRVNTYPMYVMEMCRKLPVSECQSSDWAVGFDINGDGALSSTLQNYTVGANTVSLIERDIKGYQLGQALAFSPTYSASVLTNWDTAFGTSPNSKSIRQRLGAGDTATQALESADQRYPRRVAFARYGNGVTGRINNELVATNATAPLLYRPLGIGCPLDTAATGTTATSYTYTNGCTYGGTTAGTNYGQTGSSALWFRTTTSTSNPTLNPAANESYGNGNSLFYYPLQVDANADSIIDPDGQPLVVPVLQIHRSNNDSGIRGDTSTEDEFRDRWIQQAQSGITTFNATFVLGNSPSRSAETSAGLQNFVRFLESWNGVTAKISGSFIQLKRSNFSTGPISPLFAARATNSGNNATPTNNLSLFSYELDSYPTPNDSGLLPVYAAPTRNWGFDVGLLSEQPDLFAQRFTVPPTGRPNEFFREVGRDDTWVKTLLCAGEANNQTGIPAPVVPPATPVAVTYANAVPSEYRPSGCPTIPDN